MLEDEIGKLFLLTVVRNKRECEIVVQNAPLDAPSPLP
jgi:hypothetical protein